MSNPFYEPLPDSGVPRFDLIETSHFLETFERGFTDQNAEILSIIENPESPTFMNTVEALERTGALLDRVGAVFWNLTSSDTDDELQALEL